jgi:hypothetical protein
MGVAGIIAYFVLKGWRRGLAIAVFFLAVLWTQSKGPLLALLLVLVAASVIEGRGIRRLILPIAMIVGGVVLAVMAATLADAPLLERLFVAASATSPGGGAANYGSIGARVETYTASLALIEQHPLGVGTGGWAAATGLYAMEYPHNFLLEVGSELGLALGPFLLVSYVGFLVSPVRELAYLAGFLALAQQTSGDLLDSRMWLALSLASVALWRVKVMAVPHSDLALRP